MAASPSAASSSSQLTWQAFLTPHTDAINSTHSSPLHPSSNPHHHFPALGRGDGFSARQRALHPALAQAASAAASPQDRSKMKAQALANVRNPKRSRDDEDDSSM